MYIIVEMALFNYGECLVCKNAKKDINVTLFKLFPAVVCNKISELNVYCRNCARIRNNEVRFMRHFGNQDLDKIELQIRYFNLYNPSLFEDDDLKNVRVEKMSRLINDNACDDFKKLMISYFKFRYREFKTFWFRNLGRKEILKEKIEFGILDCFWSHYSKECSSRTIVKLILYEYLLDLIGGDMIYIELDDIHKYLDDIFD